MRKWGAAALAVALAASLAADAYARPRLASVPTRDLYARMIWLWVDAYRCNPAGTSAAIEAARRRLEDRLEPLWPWLEAEIGSAEMERIRAEFDREMHYTVFTRCSSDYDRMRARSDHRAIVREFERRAKRSRR